MKLELALDPERFCACNKCDKMPLAPERKKRSDAGIKKKIPEVENETAS